MAGIHPGTGVCGPSESPLGVGFWTLGGTSGEARFLTTDQKARSSNLLARTIENPIMIGVSVNEARSIERASLTRFAEVLLKCRKRKRPENALSFDGAARYIEIVELWYHIPPERADHFAKRATPEEVKYSKTSVVAILLCLMR